jgi:hypothetical protein
MRHHSGMRLSEEEMDLFSAACHDPGNLHAVELLNLFGADQALQILEQVSSIPLGLFVDVATHIWHALHHEAVRRGMDGLKIDVE